LNLEGQYAGARVKVDDERKNPSDFALWVTNQPKHIMLWDSPWGKGFPGWHAECSAMAMKYLGETIDVHTGGIDHIPVHHTNEIAQSECATGKKYVDYWFHSDFLNIENEKMSKSLNNLYTLENIVECGYHPLSLRLLFLTSSFRTSMNFTWDSLAAAQKNLHKIWTKVAGYNHPKVVDVKDHPLIQDFENSIANNINTGAVVVMLLSLIEQPLSDESYSILLAFDKVLALDIAQAATRLNEMDEILKQSNPNEQAAQEWLKKRDVLRRNKMYKEADECRAEIEKLNFVVVDTPMGSKLQPLVKKL
jgi:cysteinyl-tRNA synthetase